jgi:hypothetical protein
VQSEGGLIADKAACCRSCKLYEGFSGTYTELYRLAPSPPHIKNIEKRGVYRHLALFLGLEGKKMDQICETPYIDFRFCAILGFGRCFMNPVSQTTTAQLAAALKEAQRLDSVEEKDKKKASPVPDIAKAIVVSISADAKQSLLDDTLK